MLGIGELRPGDDLAAADRRSTPRRLRDGDVLVVTSKVGVQGRGPAASRSTRPTRTRARPPGRQAIDAETVRVVAARGRRCGSCETRHGLVLAAAGVDASNVARDELALLPVDPDASAAAAARRPARAARRRRRRRHQRLDGTAVARRHHRRRDRRRRPHRRDRRRAAAPTPTATSSTSPRSPSPTRLAAAADLVKGKLGGVPVAVVRGLARDGKLDDDGLGSRALIRGAGRRPVPARHGRGDGGRPRGRRLGDRRRAAAARRRRRRRHAMAPDPDVGGRAYGRRSSASSPPARTRCGARARRATSPRARWSSIRPAGSVLLTLHPRVGAVGAARRALRTGRPHRARRRRPRGARGERHRRAVVRPGAARPRRAPDHLLARRADPALRRAVPRGRAGRAPNRCAATSRSTCAGSPGTRCRPARRRSCRAWSRPRAQRLGR